MASEREEAIETLRAAAEAVHRITPTTARDPIRWLLLAAAERCARSAHFLGLPVRNELELAHALLERRGRD